MTKKSFLIIILGMILLSCFGCVLACPYLLRPRTFRVSELEIPSNLFPDGAIVGHVDFLSDEHETLDDGSQSIYWNTGNGSAGFTTYRYPTTWQAMARFNDIKHLLFSGREEVWPSIADSILSSTTANTTYIACGNQSINTKDAQWWHDIKNMSFLFQQTWMIK